MIRVELPIAFSGQRSTMQGALFSQRVTDGLWEVRRLSENGEQTAVGAGKNSMQRGNGCYPGEPSGGEGPERSRNAAYPSQKAKDFISRMQKKLILRMNCRSIMHAAFFVSIARTTLPIGSFLPIVSQSNRKHNMNMKKREFTAINRDFTIITEIEQFVA